MALHLGSIFLLAFAASATVGGGSPNAATTQMVNVAKVLDNTVAIYDTVNDPRLKCVYCTRPVYSPEQMFTVYVYHFPKEKDAAGNEKTSAYCLNLTSTDSGFFSFGPCSEPRKHGVGQTLYFDGKSCYVGRLPLSGTYHCIMFVEKEYKDSVPEECVEPYDQQCGTNKYTLYDKEDCS